MEIQRENANGKLIETVSVTKSKSKPTTKVFLKLTLTSIIILSVVLYFSLDSERWVISGSDHFYFEMMSVTLSFIVAFYCILRGYALKDRLSIFLGLGFHIAGVIDLLHGVFAFLNIDQLSFEAYFIPQTWVAGRLVMSIVMMMAITRLTNHKKPEKEQSTKSLRKEVMIYTLGLTGFGILITVWSLIQPFPFVTIDFIIKRPYDIIAGAFFAIALILFFKKSLHKKMDKFYTGILLSLIIDVFVNLIISQSSFVFDTSFTVAHILKNLSYFILILTISLSISDHFKTQYNLSKLLSNHLKERHDLQHELKLNEQKFRDLYECSPNLLRTIDMNGVILNCNNEYALTLGYTKKEIIGSSIFDHIPTENLNVMQASFEFWKKVGRVGGREITMKRKDGTTFPALIIASGIYDENGNLSGSNTSITNLSELNKARKEIKEEKLKRLSAIGELSARIAHDLRNPLSVLKNTIELIQLDLGENQNEQMKNRFERIARAVTRINHQVENVLDFVREKPLKLQNSTVNSILNFVIDRINVPSTVIINLPKDDLKITCDFEKLEIVFINLIANAIQSMYNKGEINIRSRINGENCVIEVKDNGPGISDEYINNIFDPLFTTRQVGTGLGLPSCKTIIEAHKGKIEVMSTVGIGTIFRLEFPQLQDETMLELKLQTSKLLQKIKSEDNLK